MQAAPTLSPRDLARGLGVSESTVRRWVDRGEIPVRRTEGGHRRIPLEEAVAYVRRRGLTVVEPEALALELAPARDGDATTAFSAAAQRGDERAAIGLLLAEYVRGRDVAALGDDLIVPALRDVGELWKGGTEGILVEHRATAICTAAVHRLIALLPQGGPARAIGGAFPGDPYTLPSLLASATLRSVGFAATNLGANTPLAVLEEAVAAQDPALTWVAVNHVQDADDARAALTAFLERVCSAERTVVVGGRCLALLGLQPRAGLYVARSMAEISALGVGLASRRVADDPSTR